MWRALDPLVSWESPSEETGQDQLGGGEEKKDGRVDKCMSIVPSRLDEEVHVDTDILMEQKGKRGVLEH